MIVVVGFITVEIRL